MTERVLHLLLIDADEVFRLGLRVWLEQFSNFQVVADVGSAAAALLILANQTEEPNTLEPEAGVPGSPLATPRVDLVLLDLDLGDLEQAQGLSLCRQIKSMQPTLPILLLTARQEILLLSTAFNLGVEGYCLKGIAVTELVAAIAQVAAGQKYWDPELQAQILATREASPELAQTPLQSQPQDLWSGVRFRYILWRSGIKEIDTALGILNAQLRAPHLSWLERVFLTGRRREILAARWLVNLLFAPASPVPPSPEHLAPQPVSVLVEGELSTEATALSTLPEPSLLPNQAGGAAISFRDLKATLFEDTLAKLQTGLQNLTGKPLEIDILRREKKRELLYIVLRQLEDSLDELRFSQVTLQQIPQKRDRILLDVWQAATSDFFGKYYTLRLQKRGPGGVLQEVEVVTVLLQDARVVQTAILDKIPLVGELLEHLLFQAPLVVENRAYKAGSVPAKLQAEAILQNLLVQVANGVMQPLLNHFADVEVIKQTFYDRRLISTRELERFRNALSWNYRLRRYITEPTEIFESQFRLIVLSDRGLEQQAIYAPRDQELRQLSGLRLAVTLALEARDTIAPPLRSTVGFLGKGVVYVLTQVVGRGIGLIGRGILQGIGSSWQDLRRGPR